VRTETHIGLVIDVSATLAEVSVRKGGGAKRDCKACGCCSGGPISVRKFYVDRGTLREGDHVRLTVPTCSGYTSMLLMFVLPMALFILGVAMGAALGAGNNLSMILGGLAGLVLAIIIATAANHHITGRHKIEVEAITANEARCGGSQQQRQTANHE